MGDSAGQLASKPLCFVVSPIGDDQSPVRDHADMVLNVAIRPALDQDYDVKRVDEFPHPGMISTDIINSIYEAALCVVDLSFLNANVMYELGVRHTLQKSSIVIAVEGTKLPFDTAGYNTIFYNVTNFQSLIKLREKITEQAGETRRPDFRASNPISHALGQKVLSLQPDTGAQILARLSETVASVEGRLDQIERGIQRPSPRDVFPLPDFSVERSAASRLIDAANFGSKVSLTPEAREILRDAITGMPSRSHTYENKTTRFMSDDKVRDELGKALKGEARSDNKKK